MRNHDYDKRSVIELFSGTPWEAEMLHSLLLDAGIQSFLGNNVLHSYMYNPIQASGVKVTILESDLYDARLILEDFTKTLR